MKDSPDGQLVDQAKQGDVEAFAELAQRYQERIYQTIFAMTRDHLDSDDLAQETFLHAFKQLKSFRQKSSFYTWLYRIAVNLTLNFLKKMKKEKKKKTFNENVIPKNTLRASTPSPERYSIEKELQRKLGEAIDSLPIPYKTSFILVVFQGMTHSQAALALRCSEKTISWRMHKARKMLQNKLKPYLKEGLL